MAALLVLYSFHPLAGWTLLVTLAAITAGWRRRHVVRAVEA